jgi:choline monooxygenase
MSNGIRSVLAAFDPDRPLAHASTIPAAWYTDRELYELERRAVFGRTWQAVGRREVLSEPGSYLTADVAGEPVLAVRGDDGELRAFFNVCRHRAAPLLTEPCGHATKLRCRYHGWTYDFAGRLRGTPEWDGVCEFHREENGLAPVAVAEWGPFAWVHLDPPGEPVGRFAAPFPDREAFAGLHWYARREYELRCNWKVYVDNYLDGGYHVNTVHPELAGVIDYAGYTTTPDGNTVLQSSPLVPGDGAAGQTRTGTAAYWWVFPNLMVNRSDGVMDTNLVQPLGPDRCRVVFDFYFAAGTDDAFARESVAVADRVQTEDAAICEDVQRGLGSRSFTAGRFSVRRENGGHHFHRLLARALQSSV